jgi:dihydropteroate synthase
VGNFSLGEDSPIIMGVLNVTPDSFFDGGQYNSNSLALKRVEQMIVQGADIIDVGGESTKPGARKVNEAEELKRTEKIVKQIVKQFGVPVSIDTSKSTVAKAALDAGALIVNDVSAFDIDQKMWSLVREYSPSVVFNHMQGLPATMQENPTYGNVLQEVKSYLSVKVKQALDLGLDLDKICIDPGIGFGKAHVHNQELIWQMSKLSSLNCPILMGMSRKSFINRIPGLSTSDGLIPSIAAATLSSLLGATVLRVHDVQETRESIDLLRGLAQ